MATSETLVPLISDAVEIACNFSMTQSERRVVTTVHHNTEERIYNHGYEAYASYVRHVRYFIPIEQIIAIKEDSTYCEQFFKLECAHSWSLLYSYWISVDEERIDYHYDEPQGDPPCLCRFRTGACDVKGWEE